MAPFIFVSWVLNNEMIFFFRKVLYVYSLNAQLTDDYSVHTYR